MSNNTQDGPEPSSIDLATRMGVIDRQRCVELIESTPVGRIGFHADERLLVLPVNFAWFEDSVVFRTLEGQKLAAAAEGQSVCFEVDHWNAENRSGWSVVLTGTAREVTHWAEREQLEQIGLLPWSKAKWRPLWVRIDPDEITGRVLR